MDSTNEYLELSESKDSSINTVQIIKEISKDTVHRICSGQVIISLAIAVKELIENSIDAGATIIDIRLSEYGSELIEVHDNGSGVEEKNFKALAMKHYTSKLKDYSQLEKIATLGFRGEALSSLCALCDLTITTRHSTAEYATKLEYDHAGNIIKASPSARCVGTTVTLAKLFSALPVRRMEFTKNVKREYSKLHQMLTAYCIVCTSIKFTCNNKTGIGANKLVLSTQGSSSTIKQNIVCIFDAKLLSTLVEVEAIPPTKAIALDYGIELDDNEPLAFNFDFLISSTMRGNCKNSCNKQFIYINGRPCDYPKIAKLINEVYRSYNNNQYPFVYLNIKTINTVVDVNVTPDKRQVFLENEKLLLATLKTSLYNTFKDFPSTFKMQNLDINKKQNKLLGILKESSEQSVRGIKRFLTDYENKSSDRIIDIKRSKSDSCKLIDDETNILNSSGKENVLVDSENVYTSTQMLDSFIEEAQKTTSAIVVPSDISIIEQTGKDAETFNESTVTTCNESAEKTDDEMSNNFFDKSSVKKNPNILHESMYNISEKTICTFRKKSEKEKANKVATIASTLKTVDSKSKYTDKGERSKDSKSIANILEESGIEVVELTQSRDYEEILKYRKKYPLKISLQSIQNKPAMLEGDSKSQNTQINFRSNITPKSNTDAEKELQKHITKADFSKMEIIGQFNRAFIVVKLKHDLFIIDQHACDEKYNFEQLQQSTVIESQNMVRPLPLGLSAAHEELLMEYEKIFNKNGFFFVINKDDEPTKRINLTKIPLSKDYTFGKEDINEMLCLLQEDDSTANTLRPSRVRMMFASRACRKSIMIGKTLNHTEMRKLMNHMGEIDEPWNCPHGRPTMRHLVHLGTMNK